MLTRCLCPIAARWLKLVAILFLLDLHSCAKRRDADLRCAAQNAWFVFVVFFWDIHKEQSSLALEVGFALNFLARLTCLKDDFVKWQYDSYVWMIFQVLDTCPPIFQHFVQHTYFSFWTAGLTGDVASPHDCLCAKISRKASCKIWTAKSKISKWKMLVKCGKDKKTTMAHGYPEIILGPLRKGKLSSSLDQCRRGWWTSWTATWNRKCYDRKAGDIPRARIRLVWYL